MASLVNDLIGYQLHCSVNQLHLRIINGINRLIDNSLECFALEFPQHPDLVVECDLCIEEKGEVATQHNAGTLRMLQDQVRIF